MANPKDKKWVVRHRGRRGNFWGDPGHGQPGTNMSRASMDRLERTVERRTRLKGKREIKDQLDE